MTFPCMELFLGGIFQVFHDFQSLWEPCCHQIILQRDSYLFLRGEGGVPVRVETNTSTGSGNFPGVAGPSPQLTLQREEGVQL